jgi:hypothetical protein
MIVFSFLLGAFVARMYYKSLLKRVEAERDSWENKAKQAQKQQYKDLFENATNQMGDYEQN